jgi:membrane protease subunit HflC
MRKHLVVFLMSLMIVLGLLATTVTYRVDSNQIGLIKTFGKTTAVIDGATDAGLHMKWPWPVQMFVRYNSGWNTVVDPATQLQLSDKQNVVLTLFCNWRIADAEKFNRKVETIRTGEDNVRSILQNYKGDVIGRRVMADLVNINPGAKTLDSMEKEVLDAAKAKLMADYGIELAVVGTNALGVTDVVSKAVIDSQIKERERDIQTFEQVGRASAEAIRQRAKSASDQILSFANRKAALIRSEGDVAAAQLYGTFKEAPQLSILLRYLDSLRKELAGKTVMVLDTNTMPTINMLKNGPNASNLTVPTLNDIQASSQPAAIEKPAKK